MRTEIEARVELPANGGEIELRGRGPDRKALSSVIAADLNALNVLEPLVLLPRFVTRS